MSMQEFGMSEYFLKYSREPFFLRVDGRLMQNMDCTMSGKEFLDLYNTFLWKLKKQ